MVVTCAIVQTFTVGNPAIKGEEDDRILTLLRPLSRLDSSSWDYNISTESCVGTMARYPG